MKEEDILEADATAVEDLTWQSTVEKLKELSVIGVVSQAIFQLSVNRETTTGGLWRQQSPPVTTKGAENADAYRCSKY